jgi:hypothetical protein
MLFRKIFAVRFKNHMKHIKTLCGKNEEIMNVKTGGIYIYHCDLRA